MMICKADFDEIFPETLPPARRAVEPKAAAGPGPAAIARWEDDGGALRRPLPRREARVPRTARDSYPVADPMWRNVALVTTLATASYGAAWTMLSRFGGRARS